MEKIVKNALAKNGIEDRIPDVIILKFDVTTKDPFDDYAISILKKKWEKIELLNKKFESFSDCNPQVCVYKSHNLIFRYFFFYQRQAACVGLLLRKLITSFQPRNNALLVQYSP